jgi:predicted nucleotidyltransferase
MSILRDYAEFIRILNDHRVRYLVIGGYAVAFHGHPRATNDVDVLIDRRDENLRRVERALVEFVGSAPRQDALRRRRGMVRIGGDVTHIDITTKVDGLLAFEPLWDRRERGELLGERVSYLSLRDLLRTKIAANRPKDQGDVAALRMLSGAAAKGAGRSRGGRGR